jgi:hypothetical protein
MYNQHIDKEKMKGKILSFAIMAILCGMLMQSCFITKTPVGAYSSQSGMPMRYSKGKQVWLFGLLPLGRTHINTPATDFMIEGKQTFGDYLISFVTLGIIETRTIKCYVKEYNNGANIYGNNYGANNNQQVRNGNNYSDDQPVNNSLVGKRVSWQTNQGSTRYGTVTNMRTPSTCEVKTEDTGSVIVLSVSKLTIE